MQKKKTWRKKKPELALKDSEKQIAHILKKNTIKLFGYQADDVTLFHHSINKGEKMKNRYSYMYV